MYKYYPEELIEEIRMSNDILSVVGEYVKLERKGKNYFGLCPFHSEKTPSFSVDPNKQLYYCFGCGKGGSVIQFVMEVENLDYIEAVKMLAERARIQLPEGDNEEERIIARKKQELLRINVEAARFFYEQLNDKKNLAPREYLTKRKVSGSIARKFGLGYSPEEWDALYNHLRKKGYDDEILLDSGLILKGKNGGYYDRFRGRIIFPIFDLRGNVIGFGGRVLDNSTPKYMNSPETLVYNKRKNLYGLNFAKNSGQKRIIVVEGYMDVISLFQFGIINTVASLGTALTESQGRILKKYAEEIIISYDADTAGMAATMRGLDLLNDIGCNVKVLIIPEGKDPDEFVKKNGPEAFNKLVENALSLVEYKIKALKSTIDTNTTEGKINFLNKAADLLSKIDNNMEREMYIKKISKEYDISQESIYAEILKRIKPKTVYKPLTRTLTAKNDNNRLKIEKNGKKSSYDKIIECERMLLCLLSIDNSLYKVVKDKIIVDEFKDEQNKEIAKIVFKRFEEKKGIVPAELINLAGEETSGVFARLIQGECNFDDNIKAVMDIIKKMELYRLEDRQKEILQQLSSGNLSTEDSEKLKLELKEVLLKMKSI
ncbi:MAG TPA: DNA primase [Hungateiclostridium thermocellum]|jgi:DNA primase|uniref:DNA primase n=2 Tax=Acetivibrio thermocellus TaxID=1515 RepID=A3DDV1_ACET2|nr:DNA primase [Acetivibrio thermocellus]CDG35590.1 DNA primase [Acetivibrio thermocellus BC1]ABN52130.1 DNA primase [Acetivibrio thermocellus ATCC 27405]ADU74386.1 DNA primase [Acetivibrio thermocellus DSM 1313]ALX08329.1 DNA primase [Acetivibrio thermocellus AD2]ANV76077.1 DNA primase [Acetivibrio thermocellus DSM 2360]